MLKSLPGGARASDHLIMADQSLQRDLQLNAMQCSLPWFYIEEVDNTRNNTRRLGRRYFWQCGPADMLAVLTVSAPGEEKTGH